jgi:hypothetical protein
MAAARTTTRTITTTTTTMMMTTTMTTTTTMVTMATVMATAATSWTPWLKLVRVGLCARMGASDKFKGENEPAKGGEYYSTCRRPSPFRSVKMPPREVKRTTEWIFGWWTL